MRGRTAVLLGIVLGAGGVAAQDDGARGAPVGPAMSAAEALASDAVRAIVPDIAAHRVQLAVAWVDEGVTPPALRRTTAGDLSLYFYPASTIKLCAAVAAAQAIEDMQDAGIAVSVDTPLVFHPLFEDEALESEDASNLAGGVITVRHEIRKLFIASDNRAFNRLYEFVGQRELNERMWRAGLGSVRITHRLAESRSAEDNRRTPRIDMRLADGGIHTIPERESDLLLDNAGVGGLLVGEAELVGGSRREGPKSFLHSNRISLIDLQDAVVMLARPDVDLGKPGFELREEHRRLLVEAMGELPRESGNPVYDPAEAPDDWVKFMLPGVREASPGAGIINKIGLAYGFTSDTAWITDGRRGVFVAGTIYTNADGVLNDDRYEYEEMAFPFWRAVGRELAGAWLGP